MNYIQACLLLSHASADGRVPQFWAMTKDDYDDLLTMTDGAGYPVVTDDCFFLGLPIWVLLPKFAMYPRLCCVSFEGTVYHWSEQAQFCFTDYAILADDCVHNISRHTMTAPTTVSQLRGAVGAMIQGFEDAGLFSNPDPSGGFLVNSEQTDEIMMTIGGASTQSSLIPPEWIEAAQERWATEQGHPIRQRFGQSIKVDYTYLPEGRE